MRKTRVAVAVVGLIVVAVPVYILNRTVQRLERIHEDKAAKQLAAANPVQQIIKEKLPGASVEELAILDQIVLRHGAGDFAAALMLAQKALLNPENSQVFKDWVKTQLPVLQMSQAWNLLKADQCPEAIDQFKQVELISSHAVDAKKGLAFCYSKLHNLGLALDYFQQYLQGHPEDRTMQLMYADTLESDMQFEQAAQILTTLAERYADDNVIKAQATVLRARAAESPKQSTIDSDHFRITYRSEEHAPLIDPALIALEESFGDFTTDFGFEVPTEKIEVFFYPSRLYKNVNAGSPDWASGIFDGRIRIPLAASQNKSMAPLQRVLRHELSHALFAQSTRSRSLPPWFNEGVAQSLECADPVPCPFPGFPPAPGAFLSEVELINSFTSFDTLKADRAYRQSLYLIATAVTLSELDFQSAMLKILHGLQAPGPLDSDRVLAPLGFNFSKLYQRAKSNWQKQTKSY